MSPLPHFDPHPTDNVMNTRVAENGDTYVRLQDVITWLMDGVDGEHKDTYVLLGGFCSVMAEHFSQFFEDDAEGAEGAAQ